MGHKYKSFLLFPCFSLYALTRNILPVPPPKVVQVAESVVMICAIPRTGKWGSIELGSTPKNLSMKILQNDIYR